jgi:DNA-binding XRE family transcriptional regulator
MMSHVEEEPRSRLARLIQTRRRELRLSERQAAADAGVARNTWASAEEGVKQLAEKSIAGIEAALRWAPGSIDRILAGGNPAPLPDQAPASAAPALPHDFDLNAEIDKVMRLDLPAQNKLKLARQITELYEQAQAERRAARR